MAKFRPAVARVASDTMLRRAIIKPTPAAGVVTVVEADPNRLLLWLYGGEPGVLFTPFTDDVAPDFIGIGGIVTNSGTLLQMTLAEHGPLVQAKWVATGGTGAAGTYILAITVIDSCSASPTASA